MNAQDWLAEATKGMPEAVCARVAAETLAHLEDAGVGEGADVLPVLGSPKTLQKELGRMYLPANRLNSLTGAKSSRSSYVFPCVSLFVALLGIDSNNDCL